MSVSTNASVVHASQALRGGPTSRFILPDSSGNTGTPATIIRDGEKAADMIRGPAPRPSA